MTSKHTPGPWVKQGGFLMGSNGANVVAADTGIGLGADSGDGVRAANGRLLRVAPRMFDLARTVASIGFHVLPKTEVCRCSRCDIVREARAIIAKVNGDPS